MMCLRSGRSLPIVCGVAPFVEEQNAAWSVVRSPDLA
jgi:hypothetical protein